MDATQHERRLWSILARMEEEEPPEPEPEPELEPELDEEDLRVLLVESMLPPSW